MNPKHRRIVAALAVLVTVLAVPPAAALTIVAPAAGTTVAPGATVLVTVVPDATEQVTAVAVGLGDNPVDATPSTATPGGFDAQVTVPTSWVGPHFIIAIASLASGSAVVDYVRVNIEPGDLRVLTVSAPSTLTTIGQVEQVTVQGTFNDGVTRFIGLPERGSTYVSSNESVLGVNPNGLIQARAKGVAELTVTNRGKTAKTVVNVNVPSPADNHIPVADAGPNITVAPGTLVTLSAARSSDADGDPLTFKWKQQSGRIVTLLDDGTAQPTFVAPNIDYQEVVVFSLVVSDNRGASTLPVTVNVTVQP